MARPMYKELTKDMLEQWGFTDIQYDCEQDKWLIKRLWFRNSSKVKTEKMIKVCDAVCKHKYTTDKSYPIITFSYNQKIISLPLSRVIYAWFNGKVENGYVVDHIDNNPYNNQPSNLQLLTQAQNLTKRFVDNPRNYVNQWAKINKIKHAIVHKAFVEGKTYEEAQIEVQKIFANN